MAEEAEAEQAPAVTPVRKRRKVVFAAAATALVALGAGGGAYFYLGKEGVAEGPAKPEPVEAESLVDVPPMTVNMRGADWASRMLRVHVMLVPGSGDAEAMKAQLPLLIDDFQPFLRELRPEDLAGSAATFRVKEELLARCNRLFGADAVRDVLIQDLVQQ